MNEQKKSKADARGYFYIVPGIIIIAVRFINYTPTWSTMDYLKVVLGVAAIIYGIYVLFKKDKQ